MVVVSGNSCQVPGVPFGKTGHLSFSLTSMEHQHAV
jgi:hypothetical protein